MHYYKRNLGDYAKKAGRLSILQHGVYNLLIDACYDRERFPTLDEAIDWVWASTSEEREAVEFVLSKFFEAQDDGTFVQRRIQEELHAYHEKAAKNKRIANERETKRKGNSTKRARTVDEPSPNQEPRTNKPITNNQLIKTPSPENEAADRVITALNQQAGKRYRLTENNRKPIKARMADGFTEADCLHVVANRVSRWKGTEQDEYLRPETLFRQKNFEGYLNDNGERDGRTGRNPEKHSQPTVADKLRGRLANMQ